MVSSKDFEPGQDVSKDGSWIKAGSALDKLIQENLEARKHIKPEHSKDKKGRK